MEYLLRWWEWEGNKWNARSKTISHIPENDEELLFQMAQLGNIHLDSVTVEEIED